MTRTPAAADTDAKMGVRSRGFRWKGGGVGERQAAEVGGECAEDERDSINQEERCNRNRLKVPANRCDSRAKMGLRGSHIFGVASFIFILLLVSSCVVDTGASESEHKNQNCK